MNSTPPISPHQFPPKATTAANRFSATFCLLYMLFCDEMLLFVCAREKKNGLLLPWVKTFIILLLWSMYVVSAGNVAASETGHYIAGTEGIKLASIAPPGHYYKVYNVFYNPHAIKDSSGSTYVRPDIHDYVMVHRPIWVTKKKILGADYFLDVLIPFAYADFRVKDTGIHDSRWSLGDICFEFFGLAWHQERRDEMFSLAVYIPTGTYSRRRPASLGKNFWTLLVSSGTTLYLDRDKTWAASVLFRYEVHSRKRKERVRPGHDFTFDWAVSKNLARLWDLGLTGYCHWQITDDSGKDVVWDKNVHDRVFAIGPEVMVYVPFLRVTCQLRHQFEFSAKDRSQGAITNISFTILF